MKRMGKWFGCVLWAVMVLSVHAFAVGYPMPAIDVQIEGIEDEICYATLLSSADSTESYSIITDESDFNGNVIPQKVKDFFLAYQDAEGYYVLGFVDDVSDEQKLDWNYGAPKRFKLLLYFPEYDSYAVAAASNVRHAFCDDFKTRVTAEQMQQLRAGVDVQNLQVEWDYHIRFSMKSLLVCIAFTTVAKCPVALCFGFRNKRQLLFLAKVNVVANVFALFIYEVMMFRYGYLRHPIQVVEIGFFVFLLESIWCTLRMPDAEREVWFGSKTTWYSLIGNVLLLMAPSFF